MTGNPRNAMVCDAPYLQNEFGDPDFFYVFNIILSFSICSQSFKEICTWGILGVNVLKFYTEISIFIYKSENAAFQMNKNRRGLISNEMWIFYQQEGYMAA